jgi:hypothetical protein
MVCKITSTLSLTIQQMWIGWMTPCIRIHPVLACDLPKFADTYLPPGHDDYDPAVVPGEKGWKLLLGNGEQVVTGAIVADNDLNFSTHKVLRQ